MHLKRILRRLAAPLVLLFLLGWPVLQARSAAPGTLEVTFLNVGQGDAALLRNISNGSSYDVLIDGGLPEAGPTVVAYLREQGVDSLEVLAASHPDSDHIGGLISVLEATDIPVLAVIYNGYPGSTQAWADFLAAAAARGLSPVAVQFPADLPWGEMTVRVLNPPAGLASPDTNDAGLVLRVEHNTVDFLFTGDISSAAEATVVARGTPVAAEVLKVAHHGSASSSSSAFLDAVQPAEAVISVGENSYGHPAPETMQRLALAGSRVWRTDLDGSVRVLSDGTTYTISGSVPRFFVFLPHAARARLGVNITALFYDGLLANEPDEYVALVNSASQPVALDGWTLRDSSGKTFSFPAVAMQPGQECRVYTNQDHPETCGFNFHSGQPIWNNTGDCAYLRDGTGNLVSEWCY